ncbi:phosphate/phosphite/phosphonate ABC transporter substrate-binding protein [Alkalihalobacterium chitinilyticum]|uniref:Phosphate/phosphite/phosphonate ABC transporter substrate-binding protein n=1 Tax=Alkalihalobacterium chitinilyticum TaxID=2980103 RepID=A0ABT5VL94_9BACI|nr:phosphate/phosphite/phosphonate ABC transporter substrate-binding protein [Alkalihalobacterium chitinilyticum]MDE5416184.1 phosphate/phosphite/phosphonate ABC transporter substrate-binding protein [Alkalihalobacterium chitinilyticum]
MKHSLRFIGLIILSIILLAACGGKDTAVPQTETAGTTTDSNSSEGQDERADWPEKVRFAVTGIEGLEELQRQFGPFKELLEDLTEVEFEFFALSDRVISATAMEYGQVDMILAGPSEYAQIKAAAPDAEPLAALERDQYHTVVIVHEESDMKEVEDLKGKKVAMKDIGSTSGHIGPSSMLLEMGLDLDRDVEIMLLGDARIDAFKNGDVDALATGVRDFVKMVEEDGEGKYRILLEGPPLPQDPFVASGELPESFRAEFSRILLEHQDEILGAILVSEDNKKYNKAKIVPITDADYDLMRETYRVLGIEL